MSQQNNKINTNIDWDERFMNLASYIAQWSKYPGRKVGAVIIDDFKIVVSIGYNGNPRGCIDNDPKKYEKNVKYLYAEHAERNAIYNARTSLVNCTIYTAWFPCADCARAIIQSGIKKIVTRKPDFEDSDWGNHFKVALKMFEETNIEIVWYEKGENPQKPDGWK